MKNVNQALDEISDIRAQLAASTRFRGFAPETLLVIATVALLVAIAQAIWPERLAADDVHYVSVWGGVLLASSASIGVEAVARARWRHGGMAGHMLEAAVRMVIPHTFAGAVIAVALCRFAPEAVWAVPGIWQLLTALIAVSSFGIMPRRIAWLAGWFFLTGTAVLFLAGIEGRLAPWMMGVPLVLGNVMAAWILHSDDGGARHA